MKLRTGENSEEPINVWTSLNDITVCLLFVLLLFIAFYMLENPPKVKTEVTPTPTQIPTPTPTPTPFGKNKMEWSEYAGKGKKLMLFDFDSDILAESFKKILFDNYKDIYRRYKASGGKCLINIEGHTDSKGSHEYNWDLGARRARSVILFLLTLKPKIPEKNYIVVSKGETEPISSGNTETDYQKNRRIVIKFVMPEKEDAKN